jgi:hypothetical protein
VHVPRRISILPGEREREKEKNPTSLKIFCSSSIEGLFPSALRRVPKSLVVMEPCGGDAPVCENTQRVESPAHGVRDHD